MEIKLFSKWRPSAILSFRILQFWSRNLYWHVILYFRSKFRINWSIWHRDIAKKRFSILRPSAILSLKNFDLLSNLHVRNENLYPCAKFDRNPIIHGWDKMEIFSKWRPSAILNFRKIAVLVTWPISACDPSSLFQILRWSANMAPRYSQKTIFNMASVRHLGFVITSSYWIRKLHSTFPTLC